MSPTKTRVLLKIFGKKSLNLTYVKGIKILAQIFRFCNCYQFKAFSLKNAVIKKI